MEEILRLFKSYLGEKSDGVNEKALRYGLLIPNSASNEIVEEAIKQYGKDGLKWNQTFHKDLEIVKNAPIEDLVIQQLLHYITTYGFEALGFYNSDLVYIPKEKLEVPELEIDTIELINIVPITPAELTEKLMVLLTSGIALSKQTIDDIMVLSDYIDKNRFDEIANREIKVALYDKYNIMPKNPDEFFRYLIFKTTGDTLKINNSQLINKIKHSDKEKALAMLESYMTTSGLAKLSSIFLRNKNLFLAFKVKKEDNLQLSANMNRIINALRKYAITYHKPLSKNILDCLTDENVDVDSKKLLELLDNITIFREIRILNGLLYRMYGSDSILYRIRNGKTFVNTLPAKTDEYLANLREIESYVYTHLINRLKEKVAGKTIYIPKNVVYAAPTSEKKFNGNFPDGSYLTLPRYDNMVYGVHWNNIKNGIKEYGFYGENEEYEYGEERVDLDLKQMNKSEVFGWDASYRNNSGNILFSGDVTDAKLPNGATEIFYVGQNYGHGAFLITLNMFTSNSQDVPFEFMIAKSDMVNDTRKNYVVNPNDIIEKINMTIKKTERERVLGFITIDDNIKFYFNDFSGGVSRRSSKQDDFTMGTFDYLQSYNKVQLKLNDLLKDAKAILTDAPTVKVQNTIIDKETGETMIEEKEIPVDLDLSINSITKETIVGLLS